MTAGWPNQDSVFTLFGNDEGPFFDAPAAPELRGSTTVPSRANLGGQRFHYMQSAGKSECQAKSPPLLTDELAWRAAYGFVAV
jgi:hypothetical protein